MPSVLVTGGAGFIGSHVAEALIADGHPVSVVDDLSTGRREFVPQAAEFFEGDIVAPESSGGRWCRWLTPRCWIPAADRR